MGDIRDRIAAVLRNHDAYDYAGGLECRCGSFRDGCGGTAVDGWSHHLADKLIEALGLTTEISFGTTYPHHPVRDVTYRRYVTDWTADA